MTKAIDGDLTASRARHTRMRYRAEMPSDPAASAPSGRPGDAGDTASGGRLRRLGRRSALGLRRATSLPVVRGTAVELAWTATHVVTYPLGVLEEKVRHPQERTTLDGLDPVRRGLIISDVEAAGTPIILVHGIVDNRSVFTMLRRGLHRRGFGRVISLNYSPLTDDVRVVADRLEALIERVCVETGYERVHVIGHSMGGFVARYFVQRMGGDARVHTLVTLGAPHQGTAVADLVPHPVTRQMRRDSDITRELAAPAPGCRTRFVAIWSDLDHLIIPHTNARIEHPDLNARNVLVGSVGHNSLPIDGRVVHEICTTLAHLDPHGKTVVEGATSIASSSSRNRPR